MSNKFADCICYKCDLFTKENIPIDCACDECPEYDEDYCGTCPKNSFCDVALYPDLYTRLESELAPEFGNYLLLHTNGRCPNDYPYPYRLACGCGDNGVLVWL